MIRNPGPWSDMTASATSKPTTCDAQLVSLVWNRVRMVQKLPELHKCRKEVESSEIPDTPLIPTPPSTPTLSQTGSGNP